MAELNPLYRTLVGFDRIASLMDTAARLDAAPIIAAAASLSTEVWLKTPPEIRQRASRSSSSGAMP